MLSNCENCKYHSEEYFLVDINCAVNPRYNNDIWKKRHTLIESCQPDCCDFCQKTDLPVSTSIQIFPAEIREVPAKSSLKSKTLHTTAILPYCAGILFYCLSITDRVSFFQNIPRVLKVYQQHSTKELILKKALCQKSFENSETLDFLSSSKSTIVAKLETARSCSQTLAPELTSEISAVKAKYEESKKIDIITSKDSLGIYKKYGKTLLKFPPTPQLYFGLFFAELNLLFVLIFITCISYLIFKSERRQTRK